MESWFSFVGTYVSVQDSPLEKMCFLLDSPPIRIFVLAPRPFVLAQNFMSGYITFLDLGSILYRNICQLLVPLL